MKKLIYLILFFISVCYINPQGLNPQGLIPKEGSLKIAADDILIEEQADGGYHLWIKHNEQIGSVMITESTADPDKKNAVYALRSGVYNSINGDEKRILDGKELDPSRGLYFLMDSTPEKHEKLGSAFHIFIPYVSEFGYPWSRSGDIYISSGTFLNIRSFSKKYGDYSGGFLDNPFVLDIIQVPVAVIPSGDYMKEAVDSFTEIADKGSGEIIYSSADKLIDDIGKVLELFAGPSVDIVFAIDTTESMKNDINILKKSFIKLLEEQLERHEKARVGIIYYKDYNEDYLTKTFPFTEDLAVAEKLVNSVRVWGGKDLPEAVYEALYEGVSSYPWEADDRVVILIGDAPPHPKPRGSITKEMVFEKAAAENVNLYTIILPP
ncbi:MAG: VWA domain-containing protein [Spirochaetia bacterium]|jgi:hypothetical protein|nr:VWA domain-containing protein [Spirochaetia bacterium]